MGNGAMKTPYHYSSPEAQIHIKNMANKTTSSEAGGESTMERMKKILSSPITRKKNIAPPTSQSQSSTSSNLAPPSQSPGWGGGGGYIGAFLEDVVQRENVHVPNLVTKVCLYIYKKGLDSEGIFRVNGNSKVVEKMRLSFDKTGDADFDDAGDVMAVAGLLKLFLREMPDALVPENLTRMFVTTQEEYAKDLEICLLKLKSLLLRLPVYNYETLKFLAQFLVTVSKKESVNKMSPMALGIVFGPNIFRCTGGIQGLKDQGITNHIALKFITQYDRLFLDDGEKSPNSPDFVLTHPGKKSKAAPPRPPPPKVEANSSPPIPSPRKNKPRHKANGGIPHYLQESPIDADPSDKTSESGSHSNQHSDEETFRSASPFVLDSDRSEYTILSPRNQHPAPSNELVEKAITCAISEHLFGGSTSEPSSDDSLQKGTPVPAPRRKRRQGDKDAPDSNDLERQPSVKERVNQFQESSNSASVKDEIKPKRQRPKSKAFELFEEKGIIIGMAPKDLKVRPHSPSSDSDTVSEDSTGRVSPPMAKPRSPAKRPASPPRQPAPETTSHFGDLPLSSELGSATAFKRPSGPKNRRNPSRPKRNTDMETIPMETSQPTENGDVPSRDSHQPPKPRTFLAEDSEKTGSDAEDQDVNHNPTKPSTSFLDQHRDDTSPDKSPSASRKPYVPPLDLSILHEHGDGSDPILADQGPSLSLQKVKHNKESEDTAVLSPRPVQMSKLKQKKNAHPDTDVPPSPPTDQTHIQSKRMEDENAALVKQFTKKIQSCKRRIKAFEENFEKERGYKPSQSDKATRPEIKRIMQQLASARKELKNLSMENLPMRIDGKWHVDPGSVFTFDVESSDDPRDLEVKAEIEDERRASTSSPSGLATLPNGRTTYGDGHITALDLSPTMGDTLQTLLRKLTDKRGLAHRPEDLGEQTREETQEEKLDVQKALLKFEDIHGRPTTKSEKELMRPLYDRYRNIKRILTKPPSPRDKLNELQAVPEDHPIEFTPSPSSAQSTSKDISVRVPIEESEEHEDFLVTKDFRLMKETMRPSPPEAPPGGEDISPEDGASRNLHELTLPQLLEEQQKARADKKHLRKLLRDFEENFLHVNGRKVLKEDREPLDAEYNKYKQVKARLKLLEALLSKHDPLYGY